MYQKKRIPVSPVQDHGVSTLPRHQHKFPLAVREQMIDERN